jgi:hypothetical protein
MRVVIATNWTRIPNLPSLIQTNLSVMGTTWWHDTNPIHSLLNNIKYTNIRPSQQHIISRAIVWPIQVTTGYVHRKQLTQRPKNIIRYVWQGLVRKVWQKKIVFIVFRLFPNISYNSLSIISLCGHVKCANFTVG